MLNTKELLRYQINFARVNGVVAVLTFIFYVMLAILGKYTQMTLFVGALVVAFLMLDAFLGKLKYFGSLTIVKISRILLAVILSAALLLGRSYKLTTNVSDDKFFFCMCLIYMLLTAIYFLVFIEHMLMFDLTERFYQINGLLQMMIPFACFCTVEYILNASMYDSDVLLIIIYLVLLTGIVFISLQSIADIIKEFMDRLFTQERLAMNSQEESNNLKLYQSKLVHANDQLSKQKVQLEIANATITRSVTEMSLQHMLAKHINSELDTGKIINFITEEMINSLNLDLCAVVILEVDSIDDANELIMSARTSEHSELGEHIDDYIRKSDFIRMYGIMPNATYVADNRVPDSKYDFLIGSNIGSLLILPMKIQENTTGVLICGKNSYGYFKENIPFYETIVEQIILALSNSFLYAKMQEMATKDALTTIFNRRYFNSLYPQLTQDATREKKDLTAILFDIDHFKNINDSYGHIFGDKVINFCGRTAGAFATKNDGLPVRYGGEEFVIIFLGKTVDEVLQITKDMHEVIKSEGFITEQNKEIHINVSIGISSYPSICKNVNDVLNRADFAMYTSKKTGRGKITIDHNDKNVSTT